MNSDLEQERIDAILYDREEAAAFARRKHIVDCSKRAHPDDWPFAELTQDQRLEKARQEARMRAGLVRGVPSVFGALS